MKPTKQQETKQLVNNIMSAKKDDSETAIYPDGTPNLAMENLRKEVDEKGGGAVFPWTMKVTQGMVQHFGHLCQTCDVETPKDVETFMLYIMQLGLNAMLKEEAYIYNKVMKNFAAQQVGKPSANIVDLPSDANATEGKDSKDK